MHRVPILPSSHPIHGISLEDGIERFFHRRQLMLNGDLHRDFSRMGCSREWLSGLFASSPPKIYLAEQVAFLPTCFSNLGELGSPLVVASVIEKMAFLKDTLEKELGRSFLTGIFTFPDDGVTFDGATANFHFWLPTIAGNTSSRIHYYHSKQDRNRLSGTGYRDLVLNKAKLQATADDIRRSPEIMIFSGAVDQKSYASFLEDFEAALFECQEDEAGHISYTTFTRELNRRFVNRMKPSLDFQSDLMFYASTFLSNGVLDWRHFVQFLIETNLLEPGDSFAKLRIERPGKPPKYVVLTVKEMRERKVIVQSRDGEMEADLEKLSNDSHTSLIENGYPTLVPGPVITYFLAYGMENNICIVDGAPFRRTALISRALQEGRRGLSKRTLNTLGYSELTWNTDHNSDPFRGLRKRYSVIDYYSIL